MMILEKSTEYSLFIYSGNRVSDPGLDAFKESLFISMRNTGNKLVIASVQEMNKMFLASVSQNRLVVFCEDVDSLKIARERFSSLKKVVYALIVIPSSYSSWGSYSLRWSKGLRDNVDADTIVLTDSDLSRRAIESELCHFRADVRIIFPRRSSKESYADNVWSFEKSKFEGAHAELKFSGVDWSFRDSTPDRTQFEANESKGIQQVDSLDAKFEANDEVISTIICPVTLQGRSLNVGILGTKLTFIDELSRDLARTTNSTVDLDEWEYLSAPSNVERSTSILESSDVIIGEWARPNNFWIQERAKADKRLIVRAHRYEVTVDFPKKIDMSRYYAGVVIVPWVGRTLVEDFSWPQDKMVYIPNYINSRYFRRTKFAGAEFTLGIVGITPDLKRLDLAIDLLERLRSEDLRYALRVRGHLPTDHINWHKQPMQAEQWGSILHRIETNPLLRNSVHFDRPGRDMASWYQGIGVILSTSDIEGSHVALAEGIASGALPVARRWPGIETLWPEDIIFDDLEAAAQEILRSRDARWRDAQVEVLQKLKCLDQDRVLQAWWDLLNGRIVDAQQAFGPIDWEARRYEKIDF